MKVAVNRCYGGFELSEIAVRRMATLGNKEAKKRVDEYDDRVAHPEKMDSIERKYGPKLYGFLWETPRNDPVLIRVIEEIGVEAAGNMSEIELVEIPDGTDFEIEEYDGKEWVSERHRTW